jgi:hypothetical protein
MALELLDLYKARICKYGTGNSESLKSHVFVNMALKLLDLYKARVCKYVTGTYGS